MPKENPLPKKKKKPKESVSWGFDWTKVGSGLGMLAVGGGILGVGLLAGKIYFYGPILMIIGLFTLITGLMGEEGIW